jgi:hypothetical protein
MLPQMNTTPQEIAFQSSESLVNLSMSSGFICFFYFSYSFFVVLVGLKGNVMRDFYSLNLQIYSQE